MKYVERWIERKRAIAKRYREGLSNLPILLPGTDTRAYHTYRDYAIRTDERDRLAKYLSGHRIDSIVHYPVPVHLTRTYRHLGHKHGDFPITERISKTVLSLPISPLLSDEEVSYTLQTIRAFYRT
jgi:dTDP-4-amino-4,6-dideoxygalactose transaminase